MTYEEFINFIESKVIFPYSLSLKARKQFGFYYYKYSMDIIKECINAGIKSYFRYDANGLPTQESVNEFLHKIGEILHKRNQSPLQDSINYIQTIGLKNHWGWNKKIARRVLDGYIRVLSLNKKLNNEKIKKELQENVVRITKESNDWKEWVGKICDMIADIAAPDWPGRWVTYCGVDNE